MAGLNLLIFIVIGQVAKETLAGPYRVISPHPQSTPGSVS